jgi:putative DNA primase/helicase
MFDVFAECVNIKEPSPVTSTSETHPLAWLDVHNARTAAWLQHRWQLDVGTTIVNEAISVVAREVPFHPLRERLLAQSYDGSTRLDTWLTTYLGAKDTPYTRQIGAKWMISAIARVFRPGCQADHVLVLEGKQGRRKSTALRALSYGYFTDEVPDLRSKDAHIQVLGIWIVEWAELDATIRSDVSRVKAFITNRAPRFRAPYDRIAATHPRQCIFAGSVNQSDWQRDETGGRRWWPTEVGTIDIEALERDRDLLWAEARLRFERGDTWWFTDTTMTDVAEKEQDDRYQGDAWDGDIAAYVQGELYVTVGDILATCFELQKKDWDQASQNRVSRCLKRLGWTRRQARDAGNAGIREWRYYAPSPVDQTSPDNANDTGDTRTGSNPPTVTTVTTVTSRYREAPHILREGSEVTKAPVTTGDAGDEVLQ